MDALAAAGEGYTGYALMGMHPSTATMMHLALLLDEDKKTRILLDRDSSENGLRVCTFLASNSIACLMGVLPGPEKDLAACLKPKRKGQLNHLFLSR
jgi:hypothetical protein